MLITVQQHRDAQLAGIPGADRINSHSSCLLAELMSTGELAHFMGLWSMKIFPVIIQMLIGAQSQRCVPKCQQCLVYALEIGGSPG